jgi:hypothetical protein
MHHSLHVALADYVLLNLIFKPKQKNWHNFFRLLRACFRFPSVEFTHYTSSHVTYCLSWLMERHNSVSIMTRLSAEPSRNIGVIPSRDKRFLGAFAKLRKAIISCVMSVRLSVLMEQLRSHRKDFHEIYI